MRLPAAFGCTLYIFHLSGLRRSIKPETCFHSFASAAIRASEINRRVSALIGLFVRSSWHQWCPWLCRRRLYFWFATVSAFLRALLSDRMLFFRCKVCIGFLLWAGGTFWVWYVLVFLIGCEVDVFISLPAPAFQALLPEPLSSFSGPDWTQYVWLCTPALNSHLFVS